MALDLIRDEDGDVLGVTAMEIETGEVMMLQARATLFATGGAAASLLQHQCLYQYRRWPGHGGACGYSAGGHGILPVSSTACMAPAC